MVCPQSVLVVAVVDSDFDGNRSIDKSNDGGGNSNEVRVSFV